MVIYVGSAMDSQYDQVLEEFIVSPLPKGALIRRANLRHIGLSAEPTQDSARGSARGDSAHDHRLVQEAGIFPMQLLCIQRLRK